MPNARSMKEAEERTEKLGTDLTDFIIKLLTSWLQWYVGAHGCGRLVFIALGLNVCGEASSPALIDKGQEIFSDNQEMDHALILTKGMVTYKQMPTAPARRSAAPDSGAISPQKAGPNAGDERLISTPQWICELALILQWVSLGGLLGAGRSELLLVASDEFIRIVLEVPDVAAFVAVYAAEYSRRLQDLLDQGLVDTDPLCDFDPGVDSDEIVATIDMSMRTALVSRPALEAMKRNQKPLAGFLHKKSIEDLEEEVASGKCHLVMELDGPVSRVVRLVVLELLNLH
eukprot:5102410-Amphidinium_carterae.1